MGFSIMLPSYHKLIDKALCTVDGPAGNFRDIDKAVEYIWERLALRHKTRGYNKTLVKQIVTDQANIPDGRDITSPELRVKLDKLGKALS